MGRSIPLRDGELTLGRSRGCSLVLQDPSVSRGHALLFVHDGKVTLQDLRSSNGTYVNGRRLVGETEVVDGDRMVLGETEIFLRRADGATEGLPPRTAEIQPFCPACGQPVDPEASSCPGCGKPLRGRLPRRSEAIGLGEVLPVGDVLSASSSGSWEATRHRPGEAGAAPEAAGVEGSPAGLPGLPSAEPGPEPTSTVAVPAASGPEEADRPARAGLWRRVSARLHRRD
jgi:pilus assembly protein CpaF